MLGAHTLVRRAQRPQPRTQLPVHQQLLLERADAGQAHVTVAQQPRRLLQSSHPPATAAGQQQQPGCPQRERPNPSRHFALMMQWVLLPLLLALLRALWSAAVPVPRPFLNEGQPIVDNVTC